MAMIDLRNYGFDEQHQQVYDMAWRYARERHHPLLRRMDDDDWFPARSQASTAAERAGKRASGAKVLGTLR